MIIILIPIVLFIIISISLLIVEIAKIFLKIFIVVFFRMIELFDIVLQLFHCAGVDVHLVIDVLMRDIVNETVETRFIIVSIDNVLMHIIQFYFIFTY